MNKEIMVFENEEFGKVTVIEKDGDPWFVAKELSEVLGYSRTNKMTIRLDDDEKADAPFWSVVSNQYRKQTVISESGFYNAVIGSKKPEAKKFKKWVTSEVLPTIRKTGRYNLPISTGFEERKGKFEMELVGLEYTSKILNMSEISKLQLVHTAHKNNKVSTQSLPHFEEEVRVNFSAKDLLTKNNCELSSIAFNKLMIASGFMIDKERSSIGKKKKYFKSLLPKGLIYGKNDASIHNPRETQPHYYEDTFMELYCIISS